MNAKWLTTTAGVIITAAILSGGSFLFYRVIELYRWSGQFSNYPNDARALSATIVEKVSESLSGEFTKIHHEFEKIRLEYEKVHDLPARTERNERAIDAIVSRVSQLELQATRALDGLANLRNSLDQQFVALVGGSKENTALLKAMADTQSGLLERLQRSEQRTLNAEVRIDQLEEVGKKAKR